MEVRETQLVLSTGIYLVKDQNHRGKIQVTILSGRLGLLKQRVSQILIQRVEF